MGSIICLFRLILQANPLFCFELWYSSCFNVKCWFHTFSKRCSHISMGVLILLIIEIVMSILSNRCASLQVDPIISTSARSILSFLNGIHSICPKLPLFSRPTTLFLQGLRVRNQVSIYSCEVYSLFSINVLIRWFPMKMLNSFKFIILHCCFFSGGSNSSFRCWSYPFPHFKCFFQVGAPLNCSPLSIRTRGVEDISEDPCFHSLSVQVILRLLSHSSHLIQPVQSPLFNQSFNRVSFSGS